MCFKKVALGHTKLSVHTSGYVNKCDCNQSGVFIVTVLKRDGIEA